jgi:predicted ATPase
LFTDIEGSTRRWEADAEGMRGQLEEHDAVLRSAIEAHRGWVFKHTGDGVASAFRAASDAVAAAIDAQRRLRLPVRMGIATGEAEWHGVDYMGRVLNRVARLMAAGHGGQVLVAAPSAGMLADVDLLDLGEHTLRDVSGVHRIFQVCAPGLRAAFPPLSTVEASPGNLPPSRSPLIGRGRELDALVGLVRSCRLLTLTGVGGVGKSRLARELAEHVQADFPGGVFWVELAPVGKRDAVVGRTAEVLGVVLQPGMPAVARIASAVAGRRVLVVVDNCEHVLDGAADVIDAILSGSDAQVIATSREGLGLQGERLWPVPSLDVSGGAGSAAVELFLERARALKPDFALREGEEAAVVEICIRLDGIALAIELAAGRMLSMSPVEVRDRLGDRFRLLVGHRRSLERHQTLRHAIEWSYEVLNPVERVVLARCAVFAGSFDQAGAVTVCGHGEIDEYEVLDALDSLVRKSMLAAMTVDGRTRYHLLETIRQFGEEQLVIFGDADATRDRFAVHFATEAAQHWEQWQGAGYRRAVDWVDVEMSNLRAAFRWAVSGGLVREAVSIAAHAVMLGFTIQRFEPVEWAEEILPDAVAFDVPQLPRVYIAAGRCAFLGRPHDALAYVRAARSLETRAGYDPFEIGWAAFQEGVVLMMAGDPATAAEVFRSQLAAEGVAGVGARCALLFISRSIPYPDDLEVLIEETFLRANERRSPFWIGYAMHAAGSALANSDPARSLAYWRDALSYVRAHRLPIIEALAARDSALVEAHHGDIRDAYALIDGAIDAFHRAGDVADVMFTLAGLARLFGRDGHPRDAATVYATCMRSSAGAGWNSALETGMAEVRAVLGEDEYQACIAFGTRLGYAEAVQHAHERISDAQAAHAI